MLFRPPRLSSQEQEVVDSIAKLKSDLSYRFGQPRRWYGVLRRNTFARAVKGSNSIEGFNVTMEDAIAAVEGDEPIDPRDEAWMAVSGYRMALSFVLQKADDPFFVYSPEVLKSLHFMMTGYDLSKHPGRWRGGSIFVRDETTGEQVYEGPPPEAVVALVDELIADLNGIDAHLPAVVRGAMAHLNLVMIHPFSDGNGRMARALQTLVLARDGSVAPPFASIEEYLGRNSRAYYDVLAEVGAGTWSPHRDARPWVRFCLVAHYRQAVTLLRRARETERLFDELEILVKQRGLPERCILALADAGVGLKVRNNTYRNAAELSHAVAGRDLRALVNAGLLEPKGERRGRHYAASSLILDLRKRIAEPRRIADPFEEPPGPPTPAKPVLPGKKSP